MKTEAIFDASGKVAIGERILEASFDDWLKYIFEINAITRQSSINSDNTYWEVDLVSTATYVAQTYETPKYWLKRYSLPQIARGISTTYDPSYGDIFTIFSDESVPTDIRKRAIQGITSLYRECFQPYCAPGLSHLNESSDNDLNGVCYMFWDIFPIYGQPEVSAFKERDDECFRVMEQTLQIDHDACRESALHGLGHWALSYPSRVSSIIEQSLKTVRKKLRPELLSYAHRAQIGNVL